MLLHMVTTPSGPRDCPGALTVLADDCPRPEPMVLKALRTVREDPVGDFARK